MFPSGATQDRRSWVEFRAEVGGNAVLESGVIGPQQALDEVSESEDPLLWRIHQTGFDENDQEAHMFWDIARLEGELLPPGVTFDRNSPDFNHSVTRSYPLGANPRPDQVEVVVHIRAVPLNVIDELEASGDLQSGLRDAIPTYDLNASRIVWTPEKAGSDLCFPDF